MVENKDIEDLLNATLRDMYYIHARHIGHGVFKLVVGPVEITVTCDEIIATRTVYNLFFDMIRDKVQERVKS